MNGKPCAASDTKGSWYNIDFKSAERSVKKLQKRIYVAYSRNDIDKMMYLQNRMIHSFYAKALAVKIVTSNRGKNTVGVDNILWKTPEEKYNAIFTLSRRGYKPKALKTVCIPKSDGTMRKIGIPTMKDRAMQTLFKFALEPVAEATADSCSFGFRKGKSSRDAIIRCKDILTDLPNRQYALKADIKSCFDNISHLWVIDNIMLDKIMLNKFIKGNCHKVDIAFGIPQGSCISSIICNIVLDGLEDYLLDIFGNDVNAVRYADDIVIFADNHNFILLSVVPEVSKFLFNRGLELSSEKTKICNISNGFDFLGYNVKRKNNQVQCVPADKNIRKLFEKTRRVLTGKFNYDETAEALKQIVMGWFNYYDIATVQSRKAALNRLINLSYETSGDSRYAELLIEIFSKIAKKESNKKRTDDKSIRKC